MKRNTIFLIFLLTSCSWFDEELSPENEVFRGSWDSDKYAIQIFSNGYGMVDIRYRGRCEGNVRINGDKMIFTSDNEDDAVGRKAFRIDERPATDDLGITYMVLDGHRFEKH